MAASLRWNVLGKRGPRRERGLSYALGFWIRSFGEFSGTGLDSPLLERAVSTPRVLSAPKGVQGTQVPVSPQGLLPTCG
jgi:hypothetical protein